VDPVTLIVAGLAAGAAQGVSDTASGAVKDAYEGLRAKVRGWFGGSPTKELVLAEHEKSPDTWQVPLQAALIETGTAGDPAVVEAAQQLLALLDAAGTQSGKYLVDLRGAQGVQVGDHNTQTNRFATPPPGGVRRGIGSAASCPGQLAPCHVWLGESGRRACTSG
jgi:hypothetical protein